MVPPDAPAAESLAPLTDLPVGQPARIVDLLLQDAEAARLRALGLCVGRTVVLVQSGEPTIVEAVGSRIGVARRLADAIRVVAGPTH